MKMWILVYVVPASWCGEVDIGPLLRIHLVLRMWIASSNTNQNNYNSTEEESCD